MEAKSCQEEGVSMMVKYVQGKSAKIWSKIVV